jgi:hypothetical protein
MKQPVCDCCTGIELVTPERITNRPGLSAIAYRAGTYATFFETMVARLSNLYLDVPSPPGSATLARIRPLSRLTTRESDDASIALLDAWAVMADILTFYQERFANEGYLPTALERRSVVELAKLIGYRARAGVAASVNLAFTVADDFNGIIPQGTRAQSIPGTGETAQYFETSDDLPARDIWNLLVPRVHRPQLITPPMTTFVGQHSLPIATGADVVDTVYFDGTATNLNTGDALVFIFNGDTDQQYLRHVESVTAQGDDKRTEVTLVPLLPQTSASSASLLLPYVDKATYLFPNSDLAQDVSEILSTVVTNIGLADSSAEAANLLRGATAQVREKRDIAVGRDFTRVSAWLDHILRTMDILVRFAVNNMLSDAGEGESGESIRFIPSKLAASPLGKLSSIVTQLALPASVQPANARRLTRSISQSFAPQADTAPRLLATLKPAAATTLYKAWSKVETPANRMEVHAVRARAALFAHNFLGVPTVPAVGSATTFKAPTIADTWGVTSGNGISEVLLDAPYDQIKPGSWAVIDRPESLVNGAANIPGERSYHRVTAVNTVTRESTSANPGFTAKVTVITVDPPWLDELTETDRDVFIKDPVGLRRTVVYTQTEALGLVDEPLDTDVQGDTIELDQTYDGLEAGRWIIVSGNRTDVENLSGITANELVMISGVAQGARAPLSVEYPLAGTPFSEIYYTTNANAFGDRLVVGKLADVSILVDDGYVTAFSTLAMLASYISMGTPVLPLPTVLNQQYRDQVELAPGLYVNAYVPTFQERYGYFPAFEGLLVDPETGVPFSQGYIGSALKSRNLFAWRITSQPVHTVLTLANKLAYKYDTRSIKIYGNVAKATHGQTSGEVLGDGNSTQAFQKFELRQAPLTYISAPTPSGADSTLSVRVNEIEWHETDNVAGLGPRDRKFVTDTDEEDTVSVIFGNGERGARPPTGTANIKATYRYGIGKTGNVKAWQISQLATHPLGVQNVINPMPATGGADRDSADQARRNAPLAVMALDRLVSTQDYADFARNYAGISKADAARLSDGRRQFVHLTIAGKDDIPIDKNSDLYRNLLTSLQQYGDPHLPIMICLRRTRLLVISAAIALLPDYQWEAVEPQLRAAMLDSFSFDRRELGQSAYLSEAVEVLQNVEGVSYVDMQYFDAVGEEVTAAQLSTLASTLSLNEFVRAETAHLRSYAELTQTTDPCARTVAAELVYLSPDVVETLTLKLIA